MISFDVKYPVHVHQKEHMWSLMMMRNKILLKRKRKRKLEMVLVKEGKRLVSKLKKF